MSTTHLRPAPARRAERRAAPTATLGADRRRRRVRSRRATWACRCCGCASSSWLTAFLGGFGLMLYAGLWMFLPADQRFEVGAPGLESATRDGKRPGRRSPARATSARPIALGALLLRRRPRRRGDLRPGRALLAGRPRRRRHRAALAAGRRGPARALDSTRTGRIDPFRAIFGSGGWAAYARIAAGLGLIVAALIVFAVAAGGGYPRRCRVAGRRPARHRSASRIVVGPWVLRLVNDLSAERAERVRTQERADVAAHLHDSVLQTLALIQKNAGDAADRRPAGARPGARPALLALRRPTATDDDARWPARCAEMAAEVEDAARRRRRRRHRR